VSALADGFAATPNGLRAMTPLALLRLNARAFADAVGGLFGRDPLLVPLSGPRGTVAALTTPDSLNGQRALNPDNRYPDWQQAVAARSALLPAFYRPARHAARIDCPLLVVAPDQDGVAPQAPAIVAGEQAPRGEVASVPGGHYAPLLAAHEDAVSAQLDFLNRNLLDAQASPEPILRVGGSS
jgi:pimeloyl-ACP methyl ester carboxylesterase